MSKSLLNFKNILQSLTDKPLLINRKTVFLIDYSLSHILDNQIEKPVNRLKSIWFLERTGQPVMKSRNPN